jgi:hypothetical protein
MKLKLRKKYFGLKVRQRFENNDVKVKQSNSSRDVQFNTKFRLRKTKFPSHFSDLIDMQKRRKGSQEKWVF